MFGCAGAAPAGRDFMALAGDELDMASDVLDEAARQRGELIELAANKLAISVARLLRR